MVESKAAAREFLRALVVTGRLPPPAPDVSADETLAAAREQGLCGVLLGAIEADGNGGAHEALAAVLRQGRRAGLVRTLGQIALGERVIGLLEERAVRALPLKGAVLAETVYDIESDRPMSDVDVLALERWPDGVTALHGAGFATLARGDHAWAFTDPVSGGILELHRSVTSCPGLFPLDAEAVWRRSRAGRRQLRRWPSAEDLLLQLALHASFQHGLVLSLVQWLDFRRVLQRAAIDPSRLLAAASEARAAVPLAAALAVAEAVVAAPVPPELRSSLEGRLPRGLQRWLAPRLATPLGFVTPAQPRLARVRWELAADRRAELVWRTVVVPEEPGERTGWLSRLAGSVGRVARLARGQLAPSLTRLRGRD